MISRMDETDSIEPGYPGRGYDPTPGFTDLQWYMFHQRNVAYFAAFSSADYDETRALATARGIVEHLPHLGEAYRGADSGRLIPDDVLRQLVTIETVDSLDGFPERWLTGGGMDVYADPALPFFRVRMARLADGPDAQGRRGFLLVWVSHVIAEGTDSAALSRSRVTAHAEAAPGRETPRGTAFGARAFAGFAAVMHLLVSRMVTPHPGNIAAATRAVPRRRLSDMARALGVRQRALLMALVAAVISGGGLPGGKKKMSTTYSTIDDGGGANRDSFMRMRMLFALLDNAPDFPTFARAVDAHLTATESRESGFNAEMNAAAIRYHRRIAGALPFLYGPKVFAFMPYDFVFGLIPPHRLTGPLSAGLMEPVYAGATQPGINGCVVVPGKQMVTFNFFMEESLLPNVARLDRLLANGA
jgi:hypothetical protein